MKRYGHLPHATATTSAMAGCTAPQGRPDYTASGALAGGLTGYGMDQVQETQLRSQAPQTLQRVGQGQPLTVQDVIENFIVDFSPYAQCIIP